MYNIVFPEEKFVLIHIPKCGGSTIYKTSLKSSPQLPPILGKIPKEYDDWNKVTTIRNPYTRLISAYRMIKYGTEYLIPYYEGNLQDFILETCAAKFDNFWESSLIEHTLPQTHELNCLRFANFICRFENYRKEVSHVFRNELGIKHFKVTKTNVSKNKKNIMIPKNLVQKINEYYLKDFKNLEYQVYNKSIRIDPEGIIYELSR